jgi:hypothetical protein
MTTVLGTTPQPMTVTAPDSCNRTHFVLFGMQNRTLHPYLAALARGRTVATGACAARATWTEPACTKRPFPPVLRQRRAPAIRSAPDVQHVDWAVGQRRDVPRAVASGGSARLPEAVEARGCRLRAARERCSPAQRHRQQRPHLMPGEHKSNNEAETSGRNKRRLPAWHHRQQRPRQRSQDRTLPHKEYLPSALSPALHALPFSHTAAPHHWQNRPRLRQSPQTTSPKSLRTQSRKGRQKMDTPTDRRDTHMHARIYTCIHPTPHPPTHMHARTHEACIEIRALKATAAKSQQ